MGFEFMMDYTGANLGEINPFVLSWELEG
jgi:hypothetical protein